MQKTYFAFSILLIAVMSALAFSQTAPTRPMFELFDLEDRAELIQQPDRPSASDCDHAGESNRSA